MQCDMFYYVLFYFQFETTVDEAPNPGKCNVCDITHKDQHGLSELLVFPLMLYHIILFL
jgi:hypothetical protein